MAFTVIFWQPVCRQFPLFIQRSEQTKTEYFCSVCPVKTLDKSVLRQLTWLGNLQFYYMFFCALRPCWIKKILAIIHANHSWIDMVFRNPTEYRYHLWSWQIQIVFNRQRLIVKVINDIERSEKTSTEQSIIHKINRATLINCFRRSEWRGLRTDNRCLPLRRKAAFMPR